MVLDGATGAFLKKERTTSNSQKSVKRRVWRDRVHRRILIHLDRLEVTHFTKLCRQEFE